MTEEIGNVTQVRYARSNGDENDEDSIDEEEGEESRELVGEEEDAYRYDDDVFEDDDNFGPSGSEESWQAEEEAKDWEKEAKKTVKIEIDEAPSERRFTIYELPSYDASSGPSAHDILKLGRPEPDEPERKIRYSLSMGVEGIARIELSPLTQKIVGCVIGEDVTTEYPWVYVRKDVIEDNIDLHTESSDFLPVSEAIRRYPDDRMLIGYAPSTTTDREFYVCLSEAGRDAIVRHIQCQRQEHENRVRTAIYKPCNVRSSSRDDEADLEVDRVTRNRPLLEIEVEAPSSVLNAPTNFADRQAGAQRDGYVELIPYRQVFGNVHRRRIGRLDQISPSVRPDAAQTPTSMMVDNWCQYRYEYTPVDASRLGEELADGFRDFLERTTDRICEEVLLNATWDVYADDYANLVRDERDTRPPVPIVYTEQQSYHDSRFVADKVINDLCWHPLLSGIAVACYTHYAKSEHIIGRKPFDEVLKASEGDNKALLWSFTDCLSPKLILECSREVTAVSFCPLDGNVIIGGCANGQIVIWDITGRLEQVETVPVQTIAEAEHKQKMKNLMSWMQEPADSSLVTPAAMTPLRYSQKYRITQIIWMPTHQKVDKNGRIASLPKDTSFEDLNWQFATSSEDGTIAFWDLKWKPTSQSGQPDGRKRKKRMPRPSALTRGISKYATLNDRLTPDYVVALQYPESNCRAVVTALSVYTPEVRKEEVQPRPQPGDDITVRRQYRPIIRKPAYAMEPKIFLGTVRGEVGCIAWEGYEFSTGAAVNREQCQWQWIKSIHDGPVTQAVRSKYHNDIVMTVGGKIFAVWRDDYNEPIFWKKSTFRYTACAWGTFRPTVLILTRVDGNVEIWDLVVKTHEPSLTQSLSGRIITGIYPHELEPQCLGFCDFNGTLRIFTAPRALLTYDPADIVWMRRFVDREVNRLREFHQWQDTWRKKNVKIIEERKRLAEEEAEKKRLAASEKVRFEAGQVEVEVDPGKASQRTRTHWEFLEDSKTRWLSIERRRMQRVIMEKKGLSPEDLENRRAPALKLRAEAARRERKIQSIMSTQDEIFRESVARLFPEQHDEPILPAEFLPALPRKRPADVVVAARDEFPEMTTESRFDDPREEIIYNFLEVQAAALADLRSRHFDHTFNWRQVLSEGLLRGRLTADLGLGRRTARRSKHSKSVHVVKDVDATTRGETFNDTRR